MTETRILFANRMFGTSLDLDEITLPIGYTATEDLAELKSADVVVFHVPTLPMLFRHTKRSGQLWVAWFMECEAHYRRLRDARFMRQFELTMSYRRDADVHAGYVPPDLLTRTVQPHPRSTGGLICSFVSGRADKSGRHRLIRELARELDLHCYGKRGNRVLADDQGHVSKLAALATYRFTLSCENAIAPDYVTEKFFDPLIAGSVPVYLGAPNVEDFAPTDRCYIDASKFGDAHALAEHLLALDDDPEAYGELLAWRDQPLRPAFRALLDDAAVHPFVRLCRCLDARRAASGGTA